MFGFSSMHPAYDHPHQTARRCGLVSGAISFAAFVIGNCAGGASVGAALLESLVAAVTVGLIAAGASYAVTILLYTTVRLHGHPDAPRHHKAQR